ncbi:MAG: CPBP family intramembrane glutamic endopeptidase [Spirochaetales bacterium]
MASPIQPKEAPGNRRLGAAFIIYTVMLIKQIVIWFLYYRSLGYSDVTLGISQAVTLVLGILFVIMFGLNFYRIGAGGRALIEGVAAIVAVYIVFFLVVVVARTAGGSAPLFRAEYSLWAFASNWILTGVAEELLFAGLIFSLLCLYPKEHQTLGREWTTVLAVAALFALWHTPGYIAIGLGADTLSWGIFGSLGLNLISWLFFGVIYLVSGNLWLTAFIHGSTDYAVLPAIVDRPALGVVFMLLGVVAALLLRRLVGHPAARADSGVTTKQAARPV